MAPTKFGLFKSRSRDQTEQPSTENLLANNNDQARSPDSANASTSKTASSDVTSFGISSLSLDDELISENNTSKRKGSDTKNIYEQNQLHYQILRNQSTSISTLQDSFNPGQSYEDMPTAFLEQDNASTSCDANSIQFDQSSLAPSEDVSVYCGNKRKPKKSRFKGMTQRDIAMWSSSNREVMQHLLFRNDTQDDLIKWEAIATARGLCTLSGTCGCEDCIDRIPNEYYSDEDAVIHTTAGLLHSLNMGCNLQ